MKTYAFSITALTIAALFALSFLFTDIEQAAGSVIYGGEYSANVITSADQGTSTIKTITGSVGSIVLTDTSSVVGFIRIYDSKATTTATTSLSLLVELDGQATEGTYTFDVAAGAGMLIDVPSNFDGAAVVTYR